MPPQKNSQSSQAAVISLTKLAQQLHNALCVCLKYLFDAKIFSAFKRNGAVFKCPSSQAQGGLLANI